MSNDLTTRNATLDDLVAALKSQEAAKEDVIVNLPRVHALNGDIVVDGVGVTGDGRTYRLMETAERQLAEKLGIPTPYLRTLHAQRPDLFDANVNGWIQGYRTPEGVEPCENDPRYVEPDTRSVMLRTFLGDVDELAIMRAILSDRYGIVDNFDALTAVLAGVRETGTHIEVMGADLTHDRMTVRIAAPEVMVNAPDLLAGYRSPFGDGGAGVVDHSGGRGIRRLANVPQWAQDKFGVNADGVFAGLVVSNSETGGGAFTIVPRLVVLRCTNGLMMTKDAMRKIHLGGKLDEGVVRWSDDTQQKALQLITAKARDAVETFLDPAYVEMKVDELSESATTPIEDVQGTIEFVAKRCAFNDEQRDSILNHFIHGGQVTAGGIMQAVTSYAQTVEDADTAFDLEAVALDAMEYAAAFN